MPYNAVALESLTKLNLNLEVDVFSWGKKKKLTPYNPPVIERVNFYNEENYDFGRIDGFLDQTHDRATDQMILQFNMNIHVHKKNLIILGYGQSGSGKTSSLIYRQSNNNSQIGIVPDLLNSLDKKIYTYLNVQFIDIPELKKYTPFIFRSFR